jgi:hypothetical protein
MSQNQSESLLFIAKGPAKARAAAIVATGKTMRRLVVPVAVKRQIPRQVAEELEVIGGIGIETDAARIRDGGKDRYC